MNLKRNYSITLNNDNFKRRRSSFLRVLLAMILFNSCITIVEFSNILPHRLMEMLNIQLIPKPPAWVKSYFDWHAIQREEFLNTTNATRTNTKCLIIICHRNQHCGGIADRLKSLPYYLRFAGQTNRLLFIKWEKFNLEDFMQPPQNGFDWRLPSFINITQVIDYQGSLIALMNDKDHELHDKQYLFLSTHLEHKHEKEFGFKQTQIESLHRVILKYFFEPADELQIQIKNTMDKLGLIHKNYVSAHYRSDDQSFHATHEALSNDVIDEKTEYEINNAIQCAVEKGNNMSMPCYFTSSNARNVKYVLQDSPFASNRNPPVKVIGIESQRIHSEHPGSNDYYEQQDHDPSELYPIFIDLWIMAYSKCVAFGNLGFGRLGARLTGGYCQINYLQNSCPAFF